ncbi:ImmA/IrrE family metallo-endopeptidase [Coraliomargarita algicola]|uniref:ImmA/IrrE family metallo-endopeptidase n=1 Tax=Coraliomargarita algicola TaxID=3092156 RepID=A0ABZ0RQL9_9BACT|nr:ImmA/IrrE family metallo-endopeptidase [Coraliomargarita sp. J2-16]WPJ95224.1 ImmA/IrrE family metallo-endopeptidase [Coraliomargarita sp. J2-16]
MEAEFWNHFPQRLKGARKMSGLSLRALSERLEKAVSYQTLSNWEKGKGNGLPEMPVLQALASVLNVRLDFLFEPIRAEIAQPEFRKRKSKLKVREETSVLQQAQVGLDRYLELESIAGASIEVENPLKSIRIETLADVEAAAERLRDAWNLGGNPIPQVVEMLEERGIRVLEADAPESFDGLAAWADDIPFMLVNRNIQDTCRLRFTLLHELGHLLLQIPEKFDTKEVERLCNRFASAMLFPTDAFKAHFGERRHHFTIQELISLKEEWGMSIAAIAYRAKDLKILSEERHRNFSINLRERGFKKKEPGTYAMAERPQRFRQLALRSYAEEVITGSKAASLLNVPYDAFLKDTLIVA